MVRSAHSVQRSAKTVRLSIVVLGVTLLVLAAAILYAELRTPARWDPLGDYPIQPVTSTIDGIDGPATTVNGLVRVSAIKCNDTSDTIRVEGSASWQAMDPPGTSIQTGTGEATRSPGCESFAYSNPIPPDVREVIEAQHNAGIARPVWRIRGIETPVRGNGEEGVPARWVTENFTVVEG